MNAPPDLRGLSRPELDALAERLEVLGVLDRRFGSIVLYPRPGERDYPLTLTETLGGLSPARLRDISSTTTRLARLAMLDGLLCGEALLQPLTDEALLQRLSEVACVVAQKGIAGLRVHGAQESASLAGDELANPGGVLRDSGSEQAGDENAPEVRDLSGLRENDRVTFELHGGVPVAITGRGDAPP